MTARLADEVLLGYLGQARTQLQVHARANRVALSYYDGSVPIQNLRIAVPARLESIGVVSDWPSTVVNSYAERMVFRGWRDNVGLGLSQAGTVAGVELATKKAITDSLIFGIGFVSLELNGPRGWQFRAIPPTAGTAVWDARMDEPVAGYRLIAGVAGDGSDDGEVLYVPGATYYLAGRGDSAPVITHVDYHAVDQPLFWRIRNQLRTDSWYGRSLISPAVRYYTQAAARTLLGMEFLREFYTRPQRYARNATIDMFTESDEPTQAERTEASWNAAMSGFLMLPPPEEGEPEMDVSQFPANSPSPYVEQLRTYSQLVGSATGIPTSYLGFSTENPPSGDAIRAWLERLVRACTAQQDLVSPDLRSMGWALSRLDGQDITWGQFAPNVTESWESPATPTLSADVDAVSKAIAAGSVSPTSDWVYDRLRIPEDERDKARREVRQSTTIAGINDLRTKMGVASSEDAQAAEQLADLGNGGGK